MRRHTRRLFPIPIKLLIWINGIWRWLSVIEIGLGCMTSTREEQERDHKDWDRTRRHHRQNEKDFPHHLRNGSRRALLEVC